MGKIMVIPQPESGGLRGGRKLSRLRIGDGRVGYLQRRGPSRHISTLVPLTV